MQVSLYCIHWSLKEVEVILKVYFFKLIYKLMTWAAAVKLALGECPRTPLVVGVGNGLIPSDNTLRWRHNGNDGVSNHQPRHCLLNRLFRRRSKKTSKFRVTGLCVGNSPGPVNSPHKGPVTRKMFPFDDVIMSHYPSQCWPRAMSPYDVTISKCVSLLFQWQWYDCQWSNLKEYG